MAISLTHTTVAVGTDAGNGEIAKAQWNENHTLTQATERLLGRTTAGVGATEEISVGTGLSLSGGMLTNTVTATAPGGSDTQIQFNNAGAFGGASGLITDGTSLTITGATNPTAPTLSLTAGSNITGTTLSGVQITGTAGQFSCNAASLSVGQLLTISGTLGGTGTITGYANPTTYRISATNGSTTFTLVNNSTGAALTTTTGTPTGLTYTVTSPGVNIAQTWNNTSVTFTGLRFNATDTASAAASLLMDLQVGGSSILNVRKDGTLAFSTSAGIRVQSGSTLNFYTSSVGHTSPSFVLTSNGVRLRDNAGSYFIGGSDDVIFGRRAAANLRFGASDAASPLAQTLSVQSVVAGTSNTAGANLTITGSQGTGTGAGGSIIFQVAPAGSTSNSVQNALATALTIGSDRIVTLNGASNAATAILRFSGATGNDSGFNGQDAGSITAITLGTKTLFFGFNVGIVCNRDNYYGWSSAQFDASATADVRLFRDAANTLALRNGTAAQTFNVYNTFTSSTNFERFRIVAQSAAAVLIGTEKGSGGGTARALALQTDGTTRLTIETNGDLTIADAENVILGTTTGTKIGTSTSQKIGFFNKTPVVQPTAVADATDNATAITQLNALLSRMRDLGLIAT